MPPFHARRSAYLPFTNTPLFACKHPVTPICGPGFLSAPCFRVMPMSLDESVARGGLQPAPRSLNRPRLAVLDHDRGFMQVLANRLEARGWEHRVLSRPVAPEALVQMRLNALVLDLA